MSQNDPNNELMSARVSSNLKIGYKFLTKLLLKATVALKIEPELDLSLLLPC